ncbi:alcohol dehydrogenase catalytic domain-containing protein [Mycolicibacterium sp. 624]|uniref:zinc-dependent alcohol dehydrogenase n=1 Tax=Mycolicibacterium sp. 624 TaxID=3156314 RepID=UPI003396700E
MTSTANPVPTRDERLIMEAAVLHGRRDLRIETRPIPEPQHGEVLLAVKTAGVCGSDLGEFAHGPVLTPIEQRHPITGHLGPLVLGHEFSGEVVALGSAVDGFGLGQLVASGASSWCDRCSHCRRGHTNRCPHYWAVGLQRNGGLAEFVSVPAHNCFPLDESGITADAGALVQPMAIAVHTVRRASVRSGSRVLVLGAGGIGAFVVAALRSLADVGELAVCEPSSARRDTARALGASETASEHSALDGGYDTVFETSGTAAGLGAAVSLVDTGGSVVLTGIQPPGTMSTELLRQVTLRELTLIGPMACIVRTDVPDAIGVLAGRDSWHDVAPVVYPLTDIGALFVRETDTARTALKPLFAPGLHKPRKSQY